MEIDRQMEHVTESLRRLGILRTYLGHRAVLAAVQLALEDESRLHQVTKGIYMEAARRCGQNWSAVERNIRTVITVVWEQNRAMLEGLARRPLLQRPCAAQFLSILSNSLLCEQRAGPVQS